MYVCSVQYVVSLLFSSFCYFLITRLMFYYIFFMSVFSFCDVCFPFLSIRCFSIVFVLFCVLFFLLCCLFPFFVQVHRPLPPGGKPMAVHKYHIIKYRIIYHTTISYHNHITYHTISYHISYHNCIIYNTS